MTEQPDLIVRASSWVLGPLLFGAAIYVTACLGWAANDPYAAPKQVLVIANTFKAVVVLMLLAAGILLGREAFMELFR